MQYLKKIYLRKTNPTPLHSIGHLSPRCPSKSLRRSLAWNLRRVSFARHVCLGCVWARFLSSLCEGNKSKANALSERHNLFTKFAVLDVHCPSSSSKNTYFQKKHAKYTSQLQLGNRNSSMQVGARKTVSQLHLDNGNFRTSIRTRLSQRQLENRDFSVRVQHSKNTSQLQLEHRKFSVQMQCAKIRKVHFPNSSWNIATFNASAVCEVHFHLFLGFSAA